LSHSVEIDVCSSDKVAYFKKIAFLLHLNSAILECRNFAAFAYGIFASVLLVFTKENNRQTELCWKFNFKFTI